MQSVCRENKLEAFVSKQFFEEEKPSNNLSIGTIVRRYNIVFRESQFIFANVHSTAV